VPDLVCKEFIRWSCFVRVGDPGKTRSTKLISYFIYYWLLPTQNLQYFSFLNLSNTHLANDNDRVEFMQSSTSGVEILEAEEEDIDLGNQMDMPKVLERSY
jgi:hypothetical protein